MLSTDTNKEDGTHLDQTEIPNRSLIYRSYWHKYVDDGGLKEKITAELQGYTVKLSEMCNRYDLDTESIGIHM